MDRPRLYRDMIAKSEGRWTPDMIARIPTAQWAAIYAPTVNVEFDLLKKVNAIRAKKGMPPLKRLIGKG